MLLLQKIQKDHHLLLALCTPLQVLDIHINLLSPVQPHIAQLWGVSWSLKLSEQLYQSIHFMCTSPNIPSFVLKQIYVHKPYFFKGTLILVNVSCFSCDLNDAAKFRCLRTELWGTFPSEVPISKKASNPASQAENGPLGSRMGTFQKSRSSQSFLRIWV